MTPAAISQHEARHIFGAAIALYILGREKYADARVLFQMDGKGGETALLTEPQSIAEQVAQLQSTAPVSKLCDPEKIVATFRGKSDVSIREAGDLSDKDLQLANDFLGPALLPAVVCLGAHHLESKLGVSRFRKLSKRLRDASNQSLVPDSGWPLEDIVPKDKALSALRAAKDDIDRMTDVPKSQLARGWDEIPRIVQG